MNRTLYLKLTLLDLLSTCLAPIYIDIYMTKLELSINLRVSYRWFFLFRINMTPVLFGNFFSVCISFCYYSFLLLETLYRFFFSFHMRIVQQWCYHFFDLRYDTYISFRIEFVSVTFYISSESIKLKILFKYWSRFDRQSSQLKLNKFSWQSYFSTAAYPWLPVPAGSSVRYTNYYEPYLFFRKQIQVVYILGGCRQWAVTHTWQAVVLPVSTWILYGCLVVLCPLSRFIISSWSLMHAAPFLYVSLYVFNEDV